MMQNKRLTILGFLFLFFAPIFLIAQDSLPSCNIIPLPNKVVLLEGQFVLSKKTVIELQDPNLQNEANLLAEQIKKFFGIKIKVVKKGSTANSKIQFVLSEISSTNPEAYELKVSSTNVLMKARSASGIYLACQSFVQQVTKSKRKANSICYEIVDEPQFAYRGMHLDVCRHFFTKEEVMKYIDFLSFYKFNIFHWHLTEDQGWRIEIKKYPLLTKVGSLRSQTVVGRQSDSASFDHTPHQGFYTQDDIREVVAYASARHITIVPEIEMPGHALAALASYPSLACFPDTFKVGMRWGVFEDVYCAGNDSVFDFLENVLTEVCALFPGKYIHIGGDECPRDRWKVCTKCQNRIRTEKLKDEHELQSYFIQRIEKYLNSKGKQIIGWDEILEGGLAPNATVMSWRGTDGGIAAAKQNHDVVMTPGNPCYFDHYQVKDKLTEPLAIGGFNPLANVYGYQPIPSVLNESQAKYILGAQGNVWTEYMPDFKQVEYMALPRMSALAEALWTKPSMKNYKNYISRLKVNVIFLDKLHVNYSKHFLKPIEIKNGK